MIVINKMSATIVDKTKTTTYGTYPINSGTKRPVYGSTCYPEANSLYFLYIPNPKIKWIVKLGKNMIAVYIYTHLLVCKCWELSFKKDFIIRTSV